MAPRRRRACSPPCAEPDPVIVEFGAFALILALLLSVLQTGLATVGLATVGRVRRSPLLAGGQPRS